MTVTEPSRQPVDPSSPEALIAEAREVQRRRRRRRLMTLGVGVGAVVAAALVHLLLAVATHSTAGPGGTRASVSRGSVLPKDPTTLAIGPSGALYIADPGRQQILKRLTNGRFEVAAGTGVAGYTGDGGFATGARIDIGYDSSMAVTRTGVLYFVQTSSAGGRNVVRRVAPDGKIATVAITTVAGIPKVAGSQLDCQGSGTSLQSVNAKDLSAVTLAIAPNGELTILASDCPRTGTHNVLLDLTHGGDFVVAPDSSILATANSGMCGYGLAYSAGVLYASCSYGSPHPHPQPDAFLVITPGRRAKALPALYDGETSSPRGLASAPGAGVVGVDFYNLVRVTPDGVRKLINLTQAKSLGTYTGFQGQKHAYSMNPEGIAVDGDGDIYLASTSAYSNGGIDFTGIVELHTNGRIQVLWTRR